MGYTEDVTQYPQARGTLYVTETHLALRGTVSTAAAAAAAAAASLSPSPPASGGAPASAPVGTSSSTTAAGNAALSGAAADDKSGTRKWLISFKDVAAVERAFLPGGKTQAPPPGHPLPHSATAKGQPALKKKGGGGETACTVACGHCGTRGVGWGGGGLAQ